MDIVERLRSHWGGERIADVSIDVADAADEIERLREALQHLIRWHDQLSAADIAKARDALKEKE